MIIVWRPSFNLGAQLLIITLDILSWLLIHRLPHTFVPQGPLPSWWRSLLILVLLVLPHLCHMAQSCQGVWQHFFHLPGMESDPLGLPPTAAWLSCCHPTLRGPAEGSEKEANSPYASLDWLCPMPSLFRNQSRRLMGKVTMARTWQQWTQLENKLDTVCATTSKHGVIHVSSNSTAWTFKIWCWKSSNPVRDLPHAPILEGLAWTGMVGNKWNQTLAPSFCMVENFYT